MKKRNLVLGVLLIVSVISPSLFGDVLYEQPINWSGTNAYLIVTSSGNDYVFHERYNFGGFTGILNEIEIWLLSTSGTFETLDFDITFTPNNVDEPDIGNEVATYNISGVESIDTGQLYLGFQVHSYTIPLSSPFDTSTAEWFSIHAPNTLNDYYWIWSATGDGTCYDQFYDNNVGGDLAFVFDDNEGALPVTLSSFTTSFSEGSSQLHWTTQSESNNLGWNIYRSETENVAECIQLNQVTIEGAGTIAEPTDYTFTDPYPVTEGSNYWFWIESISFSGETEIFGPVILEVPGEDPGQGTPEAPESYGLYQNYPNPFNPTTNISFALDHTENCEVMIYDIKGRKIKTLFKGEIDADRVYSFVWNSDDESGKDVASGIYFYKMTSERYSSTKKMILMK